MEIEAQVPQGFFPGDTFQVQTPSGLVPIQVPPGAQPGQKLHFTLQGGRAGVAHPVLLGTVVGGGPSTWDNGFQRPMGGRPYRVDPTTAQLDSLPLLQGIPVKRAERKMDEIHKGGYLALERPALPVRRRCQDAFWILPFAVVTAAVIAGAVYFSHYVTVEFSEFETNWNLPAVGGMVTAGAVGWGASLVTALLYAALAHYAPACVVWTSLIAGPVLVILGGIALIATSPILGMICILLGVLSLSCVFCCYRPFIPFMIKLVETVASVMKANPMMVFVSCLGSLLGLAWSLACGLAFTGAYLKYQEDVQNISKGEQYLLYFAAVLIFIWGAQVAYSICHVAYCGVFGRWYHQKEVNVALRKSLSVALTTSLGSICFGALLIAAVRAMEAVLRQARMDAQQDGNACCCVLLLALECVVSCIGDILEYFSEWAYVQCAVRDVSFLEAARITYSFMTCSHLEFILQDLLVNTVVNLGALLCGAVGCAAGAATGFAMGAGTGSVVAGAVIGLWAGLMSGGAAAGIISSGTKTILALWAEDPEPLRRNFPEIHQEFESRIVSRLAEL
eukprot:gb/GFBE01034866.1/.p1 GENE.gb/GFBE01034866.1/~~gb/GFBE01034866.1/.p1  ORF type:complete len:562 (+),score=106.88 gb/GFBE01034866.1/:1-1686(+)